MNPTSSRIISGLIVVAAGVALWFSLKSPVRAVVQIAEIQPLAYGSNHLPPRSPVGAAGCLATACHGGSATDALIRTKDRDCWQCSGSCWLACDPHASAYSLLTDAPQRPVRATARAIMERLHLKGSATEDARCLACHTNPTLAAPAALADPRLDKLRAEGVSCEACHGNASDYLHEHTRWNNGSRGAGHAAAGMASLNNVAECATTCMGCHVGAPAGDGRPTRDMNHDMIAAGHPRLDFDFGEFYRRLPRHWQDRDRAASGDQPRGPDFEVRAWLVGRAAHAEAACKLLTDRIQRSANDPRSPWPEFAEFNCAACHHLIPNEERVKANELSGRPAGALRWQSIWPLTQTSTEGPVASFLKAVDKPRIPHGGAILGPAKTAAAELAKMKEAFASMPDQDVLARAKVYFNRVNVASLDPDELGQATQGLAAMQRSRGKAPDAALLAKFDNAFGLLRRQNWQQFRPELKELLGMLAP